VSLGQTQPAGVYHYAVTATDPYGASSSASVTITVKASNQPPVAIVGPDITATVPHDGNPNTNSTVVVLDGSGSNDPDAGQALTYQWTDASNAVVGNAAQVFLNLIPGNYMFTLTVTDPFGAHSSSIVHVSVSPEPNGGPSVNGGADASVSLGNAFSRTASFSDPESDPVQVRWYEGATLLSSSASLNVTLSLGSHTLTVIATDPYGATANDTVVVNVTINYGWHGFDQPINNDNSSIFKLNSTIPVKFTFDERSAGGTSLYREGHQSDHRNGD